MDQAEKISTYTQTAQQIAAVIDGESSFVARMATVSNLLHHAFPHFFWTGFYVVDREKGKELVVGPYQGHDGVFAHCFWQRGLRNCC